jgi:hypothetical protein
MMDGVLTKYWDILRRSEQVRSSAMEKCSAELIKQIQEQMLAKRKSGRISVSQCKIHIEPNNADLLRMLQKSKVPCDFGLDTCTQEVLWRQHS